MNLLLKIIYIISLIQSLIWIGLSIASALVYTCVIPVEPYKSKSDFFRVTFVKLYFEGPKCIPNGTYLGKLNSDYKNPDVLNLLRQDLVFGIMIASFFINFTIYILALQLLCRGKHGYIKSKTTATFWMIFVVLSICLDGLLTVLLAFDFDTLSTYVKFKNTDGNIHDVKFIPLVFAVISSRVTVFWVWNIYSCVIIVIFVCSKKKKIKHEEENNNDNVPKEACENAKKGKVHIENKKDGVEVKKEEVGEPQIFPKHMIEYNYNNHSDWDLTQHEGITPFNEEIEDKLSEFRGSLAGEQARYPRSEYSRGSSNIKANKTFDQWENYGYDNRTFMDDVEKESVRSKRMTDFDHDLKNFQQGIQKIRKMQPRLGKKVNIPTPPPLPTHLLDC